MRFVFNLPCKIVFERGCFTRIGEEAARLGDRCLLVTGRSFARNSGYLDEAMKRLSEAGLEVKVFDRVEPNPSLENVYKGAEEGRSKYCNVVVALGGGSTIDAAKGIAFLLRNRVRIEDYFSPNEARGEAAPIVAVPSTCGTGSEVTRYSVLTNVEKRRKEVLIGDQLLPKVAMLDANIIDILSSRLVVNTAFDAISHAVEAYLSTESTRISELFALESIRVTLMNILNAFEGLPEARENLFYASMLAGIAINMAGTVAVHALGYYLTNYHEVHHGLANGIMLPHVLRFELERECEKIESIARELGYGSGEEFVAAIENLEDQTGIPKSILELGVKYSELHGFTCILIPKKLRETPVHPWG
ncbi:MAG: iron-containing alcohol dehydrogenase family protein [Thermoproteota archaeon]